ncbi:MAG: ABC transporter substrate-binding protein [Actinomycetota bacterium]
MAIVLLVLAVLAGACGADDEETAGSADGSATGSATVVAVDEPATTGDEVADEPAPAFPRDVEHALGVTTIAAEPVRIVAIDDGSAFATLLALGITPVLVGLGGTVPDPAMVPWLAQAGATDPDIEFIPGGADLSVEAIAAADPDLIVGWDAFGANPAFETIQGVAPYVGIPIAGWDEGLRIIGEATGREERAAEVAAETQSLLDGFADRVPAGAYDGSIDVVYTFPGGDIFVWTSATAIGRVLDQAGLPSLPEAEDPSDVGRPISPEQLGMLEGDGVIVVDFSGMTLGLLEENPLWASLPAVEAGRVGVLTPLESIAAGYDSALGVAANLDALERVLNQMYG